MFKTLVLFNATFEGVGIEARWTAPWDKEHADTIQDLLGLADDKNKANVWNQMKPELRKSYDALARAQKYMDLRKRFQSDTKGPFLIDSDFDPTNEELITWAKLKGMYGETE